MNNTPELLERYKISRAGLQRLIKTGQMPKPLKVGRLNRWTRAQIERFENPQPEAELHFGHESKIGAKKNSPCVTMESINKKISK